eukprot:sb/3470690/
MYSSLETTGVPPTSFNPETYLRFPQFLHEINTNLTSSERNKGRLVYSNKCVTVEGEAQETMDALTDGDRADLKQLSVACKGLFWQSDIDYTCVPCVFVMEGEFTGEKFLTSIGLPKLSVKVETLSGEYLQKLPIISYQGEDAMNVYRAPLDIIVKTVGKFDQVFHVTVGEGTINPVLQFFVAKTANDKVLGFMSASVNE